MIVLIAAAATAQIWLPPGAPAEAAAAASRVSAMWPSVAAAAPRVGINSAAVTVSDHQWVIETALNITQPCENCCDANVTCADNGDCQQHWTDPGLHICVPPQVPFVKTCATHPNAIDCVAGQVMVAIYSAAFALALIKTTVDFWAQKKPAALVL
jgi:hypothetical protein